MTSSMLTPRQTLQHLLHVVHQRAEFNDLRLHDLLAAEGQKLARQRGGPIGRLEHLQHVVAIGVTRRKAIEKHLAVTRNHRQQVVEVVSDATGQATDGLHFLHLPELFFQPLALRVIRNDFNNSGDRAIGVAQWSSPETHVYPMAIFVAAPFLRSRLEFTCRDSVKAPAE